MTVKAPTNSFATSEGIIDRCGAMSAQVFTLGDGSDTNPTNNWVTITGPNFTTGDYTLAIDTKLALNIIGTSATID